MKNFIVQMDYDISKNAVLTQDRLPTIKEINEIEHVCRGVAVGTKKWGGIYEPLKPV